MGYGTWVYSSFMFYFKLCHLKVLEMGFSGGSEDKEPACNVGDQGSIPGLERSPREGIGNPLWYSCLENSMNRRAWWARVHAVCAESE